MSAHSHTVTKAVAALAAVAVLAFGANAITKGDASAAGASGRDRKSTRLNSSHT